jgi:hypothetical protein
MPLSSHAVLAHKLKERPPRLIARAGGVGDVAMGTAQCVFQVASFQLIDDFALHSLQRSRADEVVYVHRAAGLFFLVHQRQIVGVDRPRQAEAARIFYAVLKLAHIARPVISLHSLKRRAPTTIRGRR